MFLQNTSPRVDMKHGVKWLKAWYNCTFDKIFEFAIAFQAANFFLVFFKFIETRFELPGTKCSLITLVLLVLLFRPVLARLLSIWLF